MTIADKLRAKLPNMSADCMRLNAGIACGATAEKGAVAFVMTPMPVAAKKRIRQSAKGPNKTERAFFAWLHATFQQHLHHEQAVTFQIANGCRYTPDAVSFSSLTGKMFAWEVKGFMRDDAAVKLKVAARMFPCVTFRLATKRRGGIDGWSIEDVLP